VTERAPHSRRRPQDRRRQGLTLPWPTKVIGVAVVGTAAAFLGAELVRIWRLGSMPGRHGVVEGGGRSRVRRLLAVAREGYAVSRARRNAVFNMLVSFMVTLAAVRLITVGIRRSGGAGPFRNVQLGQRHVHHFVPGFVLCFISGGVAIGSDSEVLHRWMAIPFGGGVALVLDETALLLELEDVYWSEEGILSVQVAFAGMALLAAVAYGVQFLRLGTARLLESDWQAAARAWEDLSRLSGDG
jgi:hypothetical protein